MLNDMEMFATIIYQINETCYIAKLSHDTLAGKVNFVTCLIKNKFGIWYQIFDIDFRVIHEKLTFHTISNRPNVTESRPQTKPGFAFCVRSEYTLGLRRTLSWPHANTWLTQRRPRAYMESRPQFSSHLSPERHF